MNLSKRMPVWVSAKTDPIRAHWLTALVVTDAVAGGICVFAPAGDASPTLLYVSGGLLLAAAFLVAGGWSLSGGVVGSFGWGLVVATVFFAVVHWTVLWLLAPVVVGLVAVCHGLIVYEVGSRLDRERERRQSRR